MSRAIACLFLFFATFAGTTTGAAGLDENSVSQFIKTFESASANRDIDVLASLLADDIQIAITVVTDGKAIHVEMNKDDYLVSVRQSWSIWDDYRYTRDDISISLHKDHAVVTSTVHEQGSLRSEVIRQASKDTSTVRSVDGRLLLTRIEGQVVL